MPSLVARSASIRASSSALARETAQARLLVAYVAVGVFFMLLPGTLFGVISLLQVSARQSVSLVSAAQLQAHGHAQIFGWVGTFILGIGLYSVPRVRDGLRTVIHLGWTAWALWTAGVTMRWLATAYGWQWRALLPASAAMELAAFLIFVHLVSSHRPPGGGDGRLAPWVRVVIVATAGFGLTLVANVAATVYVARWGTSAAMPHGAGQRVLVLATWGFLAPFIWGFSARWLPMFLGTRPPMFALLFAGLFVTWSGIALAIADSMLAAATLLAAGAGLAVAALRLVERPIEAARTRGVHRSFPSFVRVAYGWLIAASLLGIAASVWDVSGGIWGASRHAFTVGFVSTMVFSIGQRVLPAFATRVLWSPRVMFAGLLLLNAGCLVRVTSEVVAYQRDAAWAWAVLPSSGILELSAIVLFAVNMAATMASPAIGCAHGAAPRSS
ncbi:MAG: NnrS family protein [Acidobacteria bacterium]|nr:NnrS family protein [Acidobacteriota bacterium]